MIVNDFKCLDCEKEEEYRYKYKDKGDLVCVFCKSSNLQVLMSPPNVKKLNTRDKVEHALKKRTVKDHQEHKSKRLERAKEKHKGFI